MLKPDLSAIQSQFAQALLDSKYSQPALESFSTEASLREGRLAFYRGNLSAIWQQTLTNSYPVILRLVGEDFFAGLACEYGLSCPSQSGDLNQFGAGFSGFLNETDRVGAYPYFSGVAALEWSLHRAYYAEDAPNLTLTDFLTGAAEKAQEMCLIFHPATALHSSRFNSVAVWQAHQTAEVQELSAGIAQHSYALIVRNDWHGQVIPLSEASFIALSALRSGASLGDALEAALAKNVNFDIPNELQTWFANGSFTSFCKPSV
jgi:hypothetical protein